MHIFGAEKSYCTGRKIWGVKLEVICRGPNENFGAKMGYSEVDR